MGFVCHDDHRLAEFVHGRAQDRQHLSRGSRIQISGRFVTEDDVGPADQCAGTRHTLLLPARQLAGPMVEPITQPQPIDHGIQPLPVRRTARDIQRQRDVLQRGQRRHQVERLEDETDPVAAQPGHLLVGQTGQRGIADVHGARGRRVQTRQAMHQSGLTGSGRAHDRGELALYELRAHPVQGADPGIPGPVQLRQVGRTGRDLGRGGGIGAHGIGNHAPSVTNAPGPRHRGCPPIFRGPGTRR